MTSATTTGGGSGIVSQINSISRIGGSLESNVERRRRVLSNGQIINSDDALLLETSELRKQLTQWLDFPSALAQKMGSMAPISSAQNSRVKEQITDLFEAENILSSKIRDITAFISTQKLQKKQQEARKAEKEREFAANKLENDDEEKLEREMLLMEFNDSISSIQNIIEEAEMGLKRYQDMFEDVKNSQAALRNEADNNYTYGDGRMGGPGKISQKMSKIIEDLQRVGGNLDNSTLSLDGVPYTVKLRETNFEPLDAANMASLKNLENEIKERIEVEEKTISLLDIHRKLRDKRFLNTLNKQFMLSSDPEYFQMRELQKQQHAENKEAIKKIYKICLDENSKDKGTCDEIWKTIGTLISKYMAKDDKKTLKELEENVQLLKKDFSHVFGKFINLNWDNNPVITFENCEPECSNNTKNLSEANPFKNCDCKYKDWEPLKKIFKKETHSIIFELFPIMVDNEGLEILKLRDLFVETQHWKFTNEVYAPQLHLALNEVKLKFAEYNSLKKPNMKTNISLNPISPESLISTYMDLKDVIQNVESMIQTASEERNIVIDEKEILEKTPENIKKDMETNKVFNVKAKFNEKEKDVEDNQNNHLAAIAAANVGNKVATGGLIGGTLGTLGAMTLGTAAAPLLAAGAVAGLGYGVYRHGGDIFNWAKNSLFFQ